MKRQVVILASAILLLTLPLCLFSQEADKQYAALKQIKGEVYLVENVEGGNIAVRIGEKDILMVDTGTAPGDGPKVEAAIEALTDKPVSIVVITHWHSDHVGGNVFWGEKGATIIGHENLTGRLAKSVHMDFFGGDSKPLPEAGLPKETFKDEKVIDTGTGKVKLLHVQPGHTDGDCVVYFKKEDIIHVGDLYFNGLYPYIGVSSGGSIGGMVSSLTKIIDMIGDETIVIPGHGPLSNKAELKTYVEMLSTIQGRVSKLLEEGKSLEEIQAAKPTAEFDEAWGKIWMDGDKFTELVVMSLS